jgi:cyclic beta-1,2-glucan synthetase
MSESAFYAFDHTLSYRYKAHGAQRLALKRGMGREAVVSPYSAFLTLQLDPKASAKNLRKLTDMGMEGRYGLYEAVISRRAVCAAENTSLCARSWRIISA